MKHVPSIIVALAVAGLLSTSGIFLPAAAQESGGGQPSISGVSVETANIAAGDAVAVSATVNGGTIGKNCVLTCELWIGENADALRLWSRASGDLFEVASGSKIEKTLDCAVPETLASGKTAFLRVVLSNEKAYRFDAKDIAVTVKTTGAPVILSDGLWQLESWNPPNPKDAPLELTLNHYVGHQPRVTAKAFGVAIAGAEVIARATAARIENGQSVSTDSEPVAITKGETKNIELLFPEIKAAGIYSGAVQLFDEKTGEPVSNILDVRYVAKDKIGSSLVDVLDVNLDRSSYLAGDTAFLQLALEGSATYVEGSKDIQASVALAKDGKTVASADYVFTLEDTDLAANISIASKVENPAVAVTIKKDGLVLSEYKVGEFEGTAVPENKNIFVPDQVNKDNNAKSFMIIGVAIILVLIVFLVWKFRQRSGIGMFCAFLAATAGILFAGTANAAVVTTSSHAPLNWTSPVTMQPYVTGSSVNFQGSMTHPYSAYGGGYYISGAKFYVSGDYNVPTYNCGGRQCLNTGAGAPVLLMGQLPAVSGLIKTYSYNQTYTIPSGIDLTRGLRFWVEITGTYRRWHPDAMDSSYMENSAMWVVAYQRFGNDAKFVSQNVPPVMIAGQSYPVTVTMKNSGATTWLQNYNYSLGSQNPQDNVTWGTARVSVGSTPVAPASDKAFNFNVTAPAAKGVYNFQWRMVQDGVEWFGDTTPNVAVTVKVPVMLKGTVVDENGTGIPGVVLDLCGAGTATTDSSGAWSKSVLNNDSYCVRISSGLAAGYNWIHGTGNNSCHANAATYEWQVAGENNFTNCSYSDQRSWDLAADDQLNFVVNYCECGNWSAGSCGVGSCGPLQRQKTRACAPANCQSQSQCLDDTTCCICTVWTSNACGGGTCGSMQRQQTRTCTAGCQSETQCIDDASCCQCSAWSENGCGANGCGSRQMSRTRTCNPDGCGSAFECNDVASCVTLTGTLAANPTSGEVPLNSNLAATAGGTTQGTVNYTFWWNCNSDCDTVASCVAACGSWNAKADGQNQTSYSVIAPFSAAGTFYPKVVIERESRSVGAKVSVTFTDNSPPEVDDDDSDDDTGDDSSDDDSANDDSANDDSSDDDGSGSGGGSMHATQPDYCDSSPGVTCSWAYHDPDGDAQKYYQVQIDNNSDFSSPVVDSGKVMSSSESYATRVGELEYDTTYYWRAKVWDARGAESVWYAGPSFTTPAHAYPRISISWNPTRPVIGELVVFSYEAQLFGGAGIASKTWTFENGTPSTSSAEHPEVSYPARGDFKVRLSLTDTGGYTCSEEFPFTVKRSLPDWEEI